MSKLFTHLLLNAIKYTPDGGLSTISGHLLVEGQNGQDEHPMVQINIQDTGIGIDPEFHELIFTKFYQTGEVTMHSSGRTKFKGGGPGLGLSIAHGIVRAHRGHIWVASTGHDEKNCPGSTFHIILPVHQRPNSPEVVQEFIENLAQSER
jgi:signal transduction histidine kinase